ncbi:hypothetical protein WJX77_011645 [Trebouxia sp. C0004]
MLESISKPKISKEQELRLCQALYVAYQRLSSDPSNGYSAFRQILKAGSGGAGQQRLAARLITKFACHFPSDFERSVQVLTDLTKACAAETVRSATASATLRDGLKGLGLTTGELCKLSPGHIALQQTTELLFRHFRPTVGSECPKELRLESSSAAAGLCVLFKVCARSCCLTCLQLLNRLDDQLSSAVCVFLHQHLLAPMPEDFPGPDPDLENCDPDRPSLAEEAFEQLCVVNMLRQFAPSLSGNLKDVAGWQKLLEHLVAQLVPALAAHKPPPAGPPPSLSSPEHTSSVDMVISPPPAMRLSPQRKQSPARSRGSPAGSSPRMLSLGSRGQKRSASTLRPRHSVSPSKLRGRSRDSPASSGARRASPRGSSPSTYASPFMPVRPGMVQSVPDWPLAPLPRPGLGITAVTRCIWFGGLPPNILEADLAREASKVGDVQFIVFPECPNRDEALVTFATFKGALMCWEDMNNRPVFGGRPLMLRFCPSEPSDPRMDRRLEPPPPAHVFVPNVATPGTEAAVFRDLDDGHAPRPEHSEIIHSTGVAGLLMRFSRPAMVADVLHALVHAARPGFSGGAPGGRYMSPSRGSSPVRSLGRSPSTAGFDTGPPGASGHPSGRDGHSRLGPGGGERNIKTVWVGQLNAKTTEDELRKAFKVFGPVVGCTVMWKTHCAYIDFEEASSATRARRAMNGAFLGGSALRVEFKGQHSNSAPPRRDGFSSPPRGRGVRGGRMVSPRGRSRSSRDPLGKAPYDQRPSPSRFGRGSLPASLQRSPRGSSGPFPNSQDPFPAYPQSVTGSRPPSPHSTPPVPPPSLPAATPQAISTASSQQASDFTAARGLAQAGRVHKRGSEAGGVDGQSRKKPRANKWDQQEPDLPASDTSPASQAGAKGQDPIQHAMQQAPSPPPPLPLQSPPSLKPIMPEAAAAALPAHLLPPHLTGLSHRPDHGQPHTQHAPGPVPQADLRHVSQKTVRLAVPVTAPQQTGPQSDLHQPIQLSGLQGVAEAVKPPPSLPVAWRGHLAKTGVSKCRAECLSIGPADALLPWPKLLDVRARVVVARALEQSKAHAPQNVVIRCIVSTDDIGNTLQFHDFCEYLTEKQRAGVVNFKSNSNKHTMFLIPGCQDVYQQLHVCDPQQECLVAVIVK